MKKEILIMDDAQNYEIYELSKESKFQKNENAMTDFMDHYHDDGAYHGYLYLYELTGKFDQKRTCNYEFVKQTEEEIK